MKNNSVATSKKRAFGSGDLASFVVSDVADTMATSFESCDRSKILKWLWTHRQTDATGNSENFCTHLLLFKQNGTRVILLNSSTLAIDE